VLTLPHPPPPKPVPQETVEDLLKNEQWAAAWLLAQRASDPPADKEILQEKILLRWREKARFALNERDLDSAEREAHAILERSEQDPEARAILRQCLEESVPGQLRELLGNQQFVEAALRLQEPMLSAAFRSRWREELRRAWRRRAEDLSK